MQMNYYPKILPFYMTYPMPLIWEEEDTVMRDPAVRTAETAPLLGPESMELIQVLLYGEIFRRRQKKGFRKF